MEAGEQRRAADWWDHLQGNQAQNTLGEEGGLVHLLTYLPTYILTYLLTYLFTYLLI